MIHPDTELQFINDAIGNGIVATKFIPAGTITWVLDKLDRTFTSKEFNSLEPSYKELLEIYSFRDSEGNYILCWDNGKYVNHSFKSNCLSTAYDFELAIRDIHPGEQLTDDYGYLNVSEPFEGVDEGTERKVVYPDDLLQYYRVWDKKLRTVFDIVPELDQPLKHLITDNLWDKIVDIAEDPKEMDSILNNYYPQDGITQKTE